MVLLFRRSWQHSQQESFIWLTETGFFGFGLQAWQKFNVWSLQIEECTPLSLYLRRKLQEIHRYQLLAMLL